MINKLTTIIFFLLLLPLQAAQDTTTCCFLEKINNQFVLHLSGEPYDMGFQHGKLLKAQVQKNLQLIEEKKTQFKDQFAAFSSNIAKLSSFIPQAYMDEMKGLAEGAEVPLEKIVALNLFPEMFHCSGLTYTGEATLDGSLYHVRILDYNIGKNLQETAVLIVTKPTAGYAFMNLSYAGFIGVVTGMNEQKIAVGEIGGKGYGYWNGTPMTFLMREILQKTASLEQAKQLLSNSPRTCEYYYIVSDGNTNDSFGAYATQSQIHFIEPGSSYAILAPRNLPENYGKDGINDKFFLTPCVIKQSPYQTLLFDEENHLAMLYHGQLPHTILLTGYTFADRYPVIIDRTLINYGRIDENTLQKMILSPISMESNLHNAIFQPSKLLAWISHASPSGEPAYSQPYFQISLEELLEKN